MKHTRLRGLTLVRRVVAEEEKGKRQRASSQKGSEILSRSRMMALLSITAVLSLGSTLKMIQEPLKSVVPVLQII